MTYVTTQPAARTTTPPGTSAPVPGQTPAAVTPAPQPPSKKRLRLSLGQVVWAVAILCVVTGLLWLVWPRPQAVETAVIGSGLVRQDIIDEGRTRIHDVFIVATPVTGDLQRVDIEPGDTVTAGQIVAELLPAPSMPLDPRSAAEAQAGIAAAAAGVEAAQANLVLAQRNQQRTLLLFDKGYASQAAVDTINSTVDAARAAVAARQADLRQARVAAETPSTRPGHVTAIRSPVAGRVLQLRQQSESILAAGTPILDIGNPANLEIVAEFLSQDAVQMKVGDRAFIEGWGGDPVAAHVTRIEPFAHTKISALGVEEQRVNVIARPDVPKSAPVLGHGFRVDLRVIVSQQDDALRVPVGALVRNGDAWTVFRLDAGKVHQVPVTLGNGGDDFRAVVSGLRRGDRVVVYPGDTLKSGEAVKVRPQAGAS